MVKADILKILRSEQVSENSLRRINNCFDRHGDMFDHIDSEAKRFTLLRQRGLIDEQEFFIGRDYDTKITSESTQIKPSCMFAVTIPLKQSLKIFLELPGMFMAIFNYMKYLKTHTKIITNILQGDLWLSKYSPLFADSLVIPLYVFYDDLEVGNALGSHAGKNKFGCVYVAIACLPAHIASRLTSITFSTIFYSNKRKKPEYKKAFSSLVNELNYLQKEGILIRVLHKLIRVQFQVVLILGDNLGLNSILGFSESFSATHYCRICKASKKLQKNDGRRYKITA